ncbi:amidohydrolase family protein [Roseateles sp. NT4]|uniref:amidohydrolase family protein n=1 Tax=Roseateles sp. NT4 TaxID=3453715 RepID=UPI003EEDAE93
MTSVGLTSSRRLILGALGAPALGLVGAPALSATKVLDAHVHLYDPASLSHPWLRDVGPINHKIGVVDHAVSAQGVVDGIVCIEAAPVIERSLAEVRWLREQAAASPAIRAIVAQARVESGASVEAELEAMAPFGLVKGIRRIVGAPFQKDPLFASRPGLIEGLRRLGKYGLSFDLAGVGPENLDLVIRTVRKCPRTLFVLDHSGRPLIAKGQLEPWRRQIRELAAMPNVYCKLSNLARDAATPNGRPQALWQKSKVEAIQPFFDVAVDAFGIERLMFGSDFPVVTLNPGETVKSSVDLCRALLAGASDIQKERFFSGTAREFYRITA